MLLETFRPVFDRLTCGGRDWSLRLVHERAENVVVRRGVVQPPALVDDLGAMVTVVKGGGCGYAATCDLSPGGLQRAVDAAETWADAVARASLVDWAGIEPGRAGGRFRGPHGEPFDRKWWLDLLRAEGAAMAFDPRIVDWEVSVEARTADHCRISSLGPAVEQQFHYLLPSLSATANDGPVTQTRSLNGQRGICQQGGSEIVERFGIRGAGARVASEALELLGAPECPSGNLDVLLMPDQMILQIHESIGHPLELDRILGDERNFAGTSFVTPDMFGTYVYGSELLDITFDPTRPEELATYAWDDDGTPAERAHLIRRGILERPLGSRLSGARAKLPHVANARADNWNRAPIDRMANLNLEPGGSTLEEMIASIDDGVLMATNNSWSIDDSRNKFQFGCEYGRVIRSGKLGHVVRNPGYRGISANFWRSLRMVGNAATVRVLGTPYCGKGEPSQVIRVGHASPACVFTGVEVFGGAR